MFKMPAQNIGLTWVRLGRGHLWCRVRHEKRGYFAYRFLGRRSADPRPRQAAGGGQLWYGSSWGIDPSGGSGRLVTRLHTPPFSNSRHQVSAIAPLRLSMTSRWPSDPAMRSATVRAIAS